MSGFTETYLLDCNRRLSAEFRADPNNDSKNVFTCEVGEGLDLNIGDQVSIHSAYVSSRGAGGDVLEIKGSEFQETYTLERTNIETLLTDVNSSLAYGDNKATVINVSNVTETYSLKDNEIILPISYYKNVNGEQHFHLPRRFDKRYQDPTTTGQNNNNWLSLFQTAKDIDNVEFGDIPNCSFRYNTVDTGAPYFNIGNVGLTHIYPNKNASFTQTHLGYLLTCGADMEFVKNIYDRIGNTQIINGSFVAQAPLEQDIVIIENSSRTSSVKNLYYANDNSRYTIFCRQGVSVYDFDNASYLNYDTGDLNSNSDLDINGTFYSSKLFSAPVSNVKRGPWCQKYDLYQEHIRLSIDAGYDTPSNIADTLSNQLSKVDQPQTIIANTSLTWSASATTKNVNKSPISIINQSPTFKLFRAGNPVSFGKTAYEQYDTNASSQETMNYVNAFQFIGVKRPDLFKLGRNLHGEYILSNASLSEFGKNASWNEPRLGGYVSWKLLTKYDSNAEPGNASSLLVTDRLWNENDADEDRRLLHGAPLLARISELFKAQGKYPELFDYPNFTQSDITSDISKDYCRFIHMASRIYRGSIPNPQAGTPQPGANSSWTNQDDSLGNDYYASGFGNDLYFDNINFLSSNPMFVLYDPNRADIPGEGKDRQNFSDLGYGFAVKYRHTNGFDYIAFATSSTDHPRLNYNFGVYGTKTTTNASHLWEAGVRCGWDFNANAYGCPLIGLYTGEGKFGFDIGVEKGPVRAQLNSNAVAGTPANHYEQDLAITDGYINDLYLGSISPLINFDNVQNRFTISDLHTPEFVSQPANSGKDADTPLTNDQAKDKCYKINKRLNGATFCPDMIPYRSQFEQSSANSSLTIGNQNLKRFTIFDAHSGIQLQDLGINNQLWKKTLWNTLGFTYDQFSASLQNGQYRIQDTFTPDMFPITTNQKVVSSDIFEYNTNRFGAILYQPQLPLTIVNASLSSGTTNVTPQKIPYDPPIVVAGSVSSRIIAQGLPTKSTRPYYLITSDIVPNNNYRGSTGDLGVAGVVTKINGYQDAYQQDGTQMSFTITKPTSINHIKTAILDPDGSPARVDDNSGVIYKVQKQINAQMNLVDVFLQQEQMKEKQRQQMDQQFAQVLQQGGQYSAMQNYIQNQQLMARAPVPSRFINSEVEQAIINQESGLDAEIVNQAISSMEAEQRAYLQQLQQGNQLAHTPVDPEEYLQRLEDFNYIQQQQAILSQMTPSTLEPEPAEFIPDIPDITPQQVEGERTRVRAEEEARRQEALQRERTTTRTSRIGQLLGARDTANVTAQSTERPQEQQLDVGEEVPLPPLLFQRSAGGQRGGLQQYLASLPPEQRQQQERLQQLFERGAGVIAERSERSERQRTQQQEKPKPE